MKSRRKSRPATTVLSSPGQRLLNRNRRSTPGSSGCCQNANQIRVSINTGAPQLPKTRALDLALICDLRAQVTSGLAPRDFQNPRCGNLRSELVDCAIAVGPTMDRRTVELAGESRHHSRVGEGTVGRAGKRVQHFLHPSASALAQPKDSS